MKTIVITGSTRGIGYGLATEFLKRGHQVLISGSSESSTHKALEALRSTYSDKVYGQACDVANYDEVQRLWDVAITHFGHIDIWVNNAGVTNSSEMVWEQAYTELKRVVDINILGMIYGSQIAAREMNQQGYGQIFNMTGFGGNGSMRKGMTLYGMSKRALEYFTESLAQELESSPAKIGILSPGIVITDFLLDGYGGDQSKLDKAKGIFNTLGDKVETVTPFLVEGMLNSSKNGDRIEWLTRGKILQRFLTAPFKKRDLFDDKK